MINPTFLRKSIIRGQSLGTSITTEQWLAIETGTFDNMYLGDYWSMEGYIWRIVDFDYWWGRGDDKKCTTHHVTIMPDQCLGYGQMNTSGSNASGYLGSSGFSYVSTTLLDFISNIFGNDYILPVETLLTNAVVNNQLGHVWTTSKIALPNLAMCTGNLGRESTEATSQLALFRLDPKYIIGLYDNKMYWLRTVNEGDGFYIITHAGNIVGVSASNIHDYRPIFNICNKQT